ncbi:MAG: diaminopimelate epimerase [Flavobacteriaceae bacterium]|nr:MAG: diaminopimelate epimerase [Flavobacteriaceae bacterium]
MKLEFYKYQGTGNDFVMIDNRSLDFPKDNKKLINKLCDRRFGIGADGLILLENDSKSDFKMVYFNADGALGSMCGNGGRCTVAFAKMLGVIDEKTTFDAADGLHNATIKEGIVSLQMADISILTHYEGYSFLDTGSPHHVEFCEDVAFINVKEKGAAIRYGELYLEEGSNINFVSQTGDAHFRVRTYERGVEDETLACGTGVTAVAIIAHNLDKTTSTSIDLQVEGGLLNVSFTLEDDDYTNVFLTGPAVNTFNGHIDY